MHVEHESVNVFVWLIAASFVLHIMWSIYIKYAKQTTANMKLTYPCHYTQIVSPLF